MAAASAELGRPFMPHQRLFVDVMLELQSEAAGDPEPGEWAYTDNTLTGQRRLGKTAILTPLMTHRARLLERASMWMTAHNRDKAVERWGDVLGDLESSALRGTFSRKVGNMHEEIRWRNGSTLKPFAPNEDGLHSETPDLVSIDELWKFNAEQGRVVRAGYVPAFATSGGQALKMSTAGTDESAWLDQAVRIGRKAVNDGTRIGVLYHEYSLPDRVEVGGRMVRLRKLTDEQLIEACIAHHPAICHVPECRGPRRGAPCPHGFTVRPAALRASWTEMDDREEYLRAFGNRAASDLSTKWQAVDEGHWHAQHDGSSIPPSARVAFGVWVDEDGDDVAVAAGWRDFAGTMHVEHLHLQDGIRGIVTYVRERAERNAASVAIGNVGHARDVADELHQAGVEVQRISQADVKAAVSRHLSELKAGTWKAARNVDAADPAAEAATLERGVWGRPGVSISALGAQTMAGWGIDHAPAPKRTKLVIR